MSPLVDLPYSPLLFPPSLTESNLKAVKSVFDIVDTSFATVHFSNLTEMSNAHHVNPEMQMISRQAEKSIRRQQESILLVVQEMTKNEGKKQYSRCTHSISLS